MRTTDFTFKAKWVKAISLLPADYQAQATNAILAYAYSGTLPDNPFINSFLTLITDEIDRETRRRDRIEERRKAVPAENVTGIPQTEEHPAEVHPENTCNGTSREERLAAETRRYITNHRHYSIIFNHKILKHSANREEANSRLENILVNYIKTHPENNRIPSIAHIVCGRIGTGLEEIASTPCGT